MTIEHPNRCELYVLLHSVFDDMLGANVGALEHQLLVQAYGALCAATKVHHLNNHGENEHDNNCTHETGTNRPH